MPIQLAEEFRSNRTRPVDARGGPVGAADQPGFSGLDEAAANFSQGSPPCEYPVMLESASSDATCSARSKLIPVHHRTLDRLQGRRAHPYHEGGTRATIG